MNAPRILVAGIGNIFIGDDGFGVEVAQALAHEPFPAEVTVRDFGIRSYDLAYALVDGYDAVIFVDTTPRHQPPGTLCLLELDPPDPAHGSEAGVNGHCLHPVAVLGLAATFGASLGRLYLVGCEPAVLENDDGEIGLSAAVRAAVPAAVAMIKAHVTDLLSSSHLQPSDPVWAAPNKGNSHECLGHSRNRDRGAGAALPGEDVPGTAALPAHA